MGVCPAAPVSHTDPCLTQAQFSTGPSRVPLLCLAPFLARRSYCSCCGACTSATSEASHPLHSPRQRPRSLCPPALYWPFPGISPGLSCEWPRHKVPVCNVYRPLRQRTPIAFLRSPVCWCCTAKMPGRPHSPMSPSGLDPGFLHLLSEECSWISHVIGSCLVPCGGVDDANLGPEILNSRRPGRPIPFWLS